MKWFKGSGKTSCFPSKSMCPFCKESRSVNLEKGRWGGTLPNK